MKKYYLFASLVLIAASPAFAQTKIGAPGAPDGSAMLEVTSGTSGNKGLLLPRMTLTQRNAIPAPATGLMIYNTTANQVQVNTGTPAAPIWVIATATNSGWDLVGNAGTNPTTNFIGTTDSQSLVIRTNNAEKLRVTAAGNVGIGNAAPAFTLDVNGSVRVNTDVLPASNSGSAMVWNSVNSGQGETELINYKGTGGGGFRFHSLAPGVVPAAGVGELMRITGTGSVGIGTSAPAQTLHVAGTARITAAVGTPTTITGRNAAGDVGNVAIGSGLSLTGGTLSATATTDNTDWNLTGNAGTSPATNFIGTSDAQPLVIRTNNTEQVRVTAAGNVGINNTNPLSPLSFESAAGSKISFYTSGSTNHYGIGVSSSQLNYHVNPGATHAFFAGGTNGDGTELMRIQGNGNVGIGTTSPAAQLHVSDTGNASIIVSTSSNEQMRVLLGSANHGIMRNLITSGGKANDVALYTSSGGGATAAGDVYLVANPVVSASDSLPIDQFVLKNTGNVGIGTNTPAQKLHVQGTARISTAVGTPTTITGRNAAGDVGNVAIGSGLSLTGGTLSATATTDNTDWNLTGNAGTSPATNFIGTSDAQPLVIRTSNTEQVRVTAAGDVGIGTTTPAQSLHVQGTARIATAVGTPTTITGRNAAGDVGNVTLGSGLSLTAGVLNTTADNADWNLTGNTGTNPATNYIGTGDAQPLVIRTNNAEKLRVTAAGNVGIGTATPAFTLDVNGSIKANNDVLAASASGSAMAWNSVNSGQGETELINYKGTGGGGFRFYSLAPSAVPAAGVGELMRITGTGNVGINNNNPLSPLSFASALGAKITYWNGGSTTNHFGIGVSNNQLNYHTMPGAAHTFYAGGTNGNGTELMRILGNGNVGIGTSTPSTKLAVNGGSLSVTNDATSPNIAAPVINVINNGGGPNFNDDVEIYSYGDSTAPEFGMWTARGTATAPVNSQANDYAGVLRFGTQVNGAKTELNRIQSVYTGDGTTAQSRLTFHANGENYPPLMAMLSNGNVGIGTLYPTATLSVNGAANNTTGTWSIFSDARVKTVDGEYEDGLATVMKIHPVKFHYNANAPFKSKEQQIGIIAQEMEQIAPYMVSKVNADGFSDLRQYNNQALPYMLVNAIQEQQEQIEALKAKNEQLEAINKVASSKIEQLEAANKVTAQLMERVKQMEQMMGINEIEGTSKIAGK